MVLDLNFHLHNTIYYTTKSYCNLEPSLNAGPSESVFEIRSIHGEGAASVRHIGQFGCEYSHISIHCTWKVCVHSGKVRKYSPSSNSLKHTGHTDSSLSKSVPFRYLWAGMSSMAVVEFSSRLPCGPVPWCCGSGCCRELHHMTRMQWYKVTVKAIDANATRKICNWERRGPSIVEIDLENCWTDSKRHIKQM